VSEIVAVDVGGTHARFAIAEVERGRLVSLGEPTRLKAAEYESFESAWDAFREAAGRPLPRSAAIAVAARPGGEAVKLTNNDWVLRPSLLADSLGVERCILINDFEAVAHAVAQLEARWFTHVCGPERPLPDTGVIGIVGPGTGLGVAQLVRAQDHYHVVPTEGGHVDFAPLDPVEDSILQKLRERFGRVSVERVASGPGLANILEALDEGGVSYPDDKALWEAALAGEKPASAALDRLCLILGAAAGDIALAQGATALVVAGGIGQRLAGRLPGSGFPARFVAKGRFTEMMETIPVKLVTHPEPGLFGAAIAFAAEEPTG
jgi:glucokinase